MTLDRMAAVLLVAIGVGMAAPGRAAAQDRWQITLRSSEIIYELRPLKLEGDGLVFQRGEGTIRVPLEEVTELRMVRGALARATSAIRATPRILAGTDDAVFEMTLLDVREKREVVERILEALASGGGGRASSSYSD